MITKGISSFCFRREMGSVVCIIYLFVCLKDASAAQLSQVFVNPANNHSYVLLTSETWTLSESEAVSMGGHLATINDQAEQDWVFTTFGCYGGSQRLLWIGLNDLAVPNVFQWSSGEPAAYTHWAGGEPNNSSGDEHFAAMYYPNHSEASYWNDWNDRTSDPIGIPFDGVVEMADSAASSVLIARTNETGLSVPFTPSWDFVTNGSLIAGKYPASALGNFNQESQFGNRSVVSLTAGGSLTINTGGSPTTTSSSYVTCGNSAGTSVIYLLTSSTNGYDVTNIVVYGGWGDSGRDQQSYTISYSNVGSLSQFVYLTTVSFNPAISNGVPSATRVSIARSVGALATNVAAVKFDFSTPGCESGYCGYAGISIFGSVYIPPAVPTSVGAALSAGNNLVLNIGEMVVGRNYEVQSTTNLASGVWTTESSFTTATTSLSVTNSMSGADQKFYRINGY